MSLHASEPRRIRAGLANILTTSESLVCEAASLVAAPDSVWDVAHPVNRASGLQAAIDGFFLPLRNALSDVRRRDEIFISGANRRSIGGDWIAAMTHYVGNFNRPLLGIEPSERLAFLRSGEFYRIETGRIVEAKLLLDFPDLMRQASRNPLPEMLGTEMLFPGPATHDGVHPDDPETGKASLDAVEGMLMDLHTFNPVTMESPGQTGRDGYWHPDMLWYGPAGIGSSYRWEGFVKDHRKSFLEAFPDRRGGDHYCRIGDGHYAAVSGWPSMTMTHKGDYLGARATNRELTLRVMDFYRCEGLKIIENWVFLDYGDLFRQMGRDLIKGEG